MGFTVAQEGNDTFTSISNMFITQYMPAANGNFVKVYLALQMACQHPDEEGDLSVSLLADRLDCTENDVLRALRYWSRKGLIQLTAEGDAISSVRLLTPGAGPIPDSGEGRGRAGRLVPPASAGKQAGVFAGADEQAAHERKIGAVHGRNTALPAESGDIPVPEKHTYTPLQAEALVKDEEMNRTISRIETLLGAPVSPAHLQTILYFMCDVGFSSELVVTLYETAVSKGKTSPSYIEAIGIDWARQGIATPEEAAEESAAFSGRYALVARALGIKRNLAPAEREIIDSWNAYHFADSIIEEACSRTVMQTGDTNLHYVSSILKGWHDSQVISLEDIKRCDEAYKSKKRNHGAPIRQSAIYRTSAPSKNQFQNFPQRSYSQSDYSSLERQLLQGHKS